ncbi:MAG: hypothetical protein H7039_18460, partial [Bryobacteraceae bacterium]|nr:hypothetical protein [Bryobacteraceae bacterium]
MAPRLPAAFLLASIALFGQSKNPVNWTLTISPASAPQGATVTAKVVARLDPGWHIYALSSPPGGPTPTTV